MTWSRAFPFPSLPTSTLRWVVALGFAIGLLVALPAAVSADTGDVGFEGPSGGGGTTGLPSAGSAPSGSKPESKLWFNDGFWWASLWDTATSDFYIWKLNQTTETWTRTNTRLDDRSSTRADVLWDGTKLYVASHNFSENDGSGTARLYRLSYDTATDTYSVDGGFPQTINSVQSETLVIAKDSTGKLWATWEQGGKIWVNRTTSGDSTWGTPFQLPGAATVNSDDISSVIAFGGNKIGIFYSNQSSSPDADSFAIHTDGSADTTGWSIETAYTGTNLADDHMNLKTDSSGRVYAVVKTSLDAPPNPGTSPYIVLLVRQTNGTWSNNVVSIASQKQTRAILEIDETNSLLRVFVTSNDTGGTINQHTSPINAISFPGGAGTVVIKDASALKINNVTSTKQNITSGTGLIVLAYNDTTRHYWHADILNTPPPNTAPTANATSASTPAGSSVSVGLSGSDPETCELTFTIVTPPGHGTLGSITPATCTAGSPNTDTASVLYTPNGGYSGPDSFTYKVNDGSLDSTAATATLTVTGTDTTPPTRTTTTVNGATLTVNYDEPLDTGSVPATSSFAPLVNGSARGVSNVGVSGSAVTLTLASPVVSTDTVTLSYTPPGVNPVQDVAGNDAVSFSGISVTNNTPPAGGGTSTFTPTDDAQVKSSSPTTNYGSLATMQLREEASPGVTYRDYLKFNVTGLGGTVSAVKLRLFITDVSPDSGTVYGVADTSWTENSIIWNNAPALGASGLGSAGATTTAGTWVEITLNPSAVAGNGVVSFGLKTTSTNSSIFSSSEGTNPPELVVTTSGAGDTTPPVFQSGTINGSALSLTYNETLDSTSIPAPGDFSISGRTLSNIVVSGTHVTATVTPAAISTDTISLSYTPPVSGPIQDVAGNDAAGLTNRSITNDTPPSDTTAPSPTTSTVNASTLVINFDEALDAASVPSTSAFDVQVAGGSRSVNNVGISGSAVTLALASPVANGDVVTVAYTKPGSPPWIQDAATNPTATFGPKSVTNNTPPADTTAPSPTGATVDGSTLAITFDEALDASSTPSGSTFDVEVAGSPRTVTNVSLSGSTATLTLASPVSSAQVVTVSYTKPGSPPWLQDAATNPTATFGPNPATNNTPPPNTAPTANATSATAPFNQGVSVGLSGSDPETCQLTFSIVAQPSHGTLGSIANAACVAGSPNTDTASVTYTPTSGYSGPDSFTYKVNDGTADSSPATATQTVSASSGGTFTFTPTDDAQIKSTSPTTNYGTLASMQLREEPSGGTLPTYRDYLKFTVSGLSGTVTAVKLRLFVSDVSTDSGSVFAVADTTWTESVITWNSAPVMGTTALGAAGATTTVGAYVDITLSPSAISGNGTFSFALKTTSTNSSIFDSSEGANTPQLVVTTS